MSDITVIKAHQTRSLSGSSDITYHLGHDDQDLLHIRLWANSAGGLHSKHWFRLDSILERIKSQQDQPVTSSTLRPVCPGSTNNRGFVLACLLAEGLLQPIPDAQHGLARIDPAGFLKEMASLIKQGAAIDIPEPVNQRQFPRTKRAKPPVVTRRTRQS